MRRRAAIPWAKRAAISTVGSMARPQTSEATVKTARPPRKTLLRPIRSPAPGEQQEAGERDQVGVDHPGEAGLGEVQVALDRRQRDVDDRRVEHDHQLARQTTISANQRRRSPNRGSAVE